MAKSKQLAKLNEWHQQLLDWVITNPPFNLGCDFALKAIDCSLAGAAILVRTAFLESADRYYRLYNVTPPTEVVQYVERVVMLTGRLVSPDRKSAIEVIVYEGGRTDVLFVSYLPTHKIEEFFPAA